LKYKIEGTDRILEVTIETCSYSSHAACKITPAHAGRCTIEPRIVGRRGAGEPEGRVITFH
jgi:hypothetical protein